MADKRKFRILVVDDESNVCECVRLILSIDGYEVVTANSGHAALEKFAAYRFDVVCTDYSMPGMNGSQLADALRAIDPQQPILMISGLAGTMTPPANVDIMLSKPFLPSELKQSIAHLLNTGSQARPGPASSAPLTCVVNEVLQ
ncbi:MAG TPA: response regulator [Candidatus Paceibacterota bacterium]|nr:response regulator [Candidatus Paceibacterota bacterium]